MNHYVLTTSHFGPEYPLDANRRRIEMLRRVTARSLASQAGDWTWIATVHPDDPLLDERLTAFRSAGHRVVATDADSAESIDWSGDVLTTRIDDDDAFAADAFARLYAAAGSLQARTVLMFPVGFRVNGDMVTPVWHMKNAYSSLFAPTGDHCHIRAVQHRHVGELAPVRIVDTRPAYLWVRHPDTNTPFRSAKEPLNAGIRRLFDVDWPAIVAAGGPWPGPLPGRSGT